MTKKKLAARVAELERLVAVQQDELTALKANLEALLRLPQPKDYPVSYR